MNLWRSRWSEVMAPLSQAGMDLVRAEYGVVTSELRGSVRLLIKALVFLLIALFALFWSIGAVAVTLVEVGALWLPRWGAALSVVGLFVLVGLGLAAAARRKLSRIEPPDKIVRRRIEEHREWWDQRISGVGEPRKSADRDSG